MKTKIFLAALATALTATAHAQVKVEDAIKWRQSAYATMGWSMARIDSNLKGTYNKEEVLKAATVLREALLAQERMTVVAPVAGQIAKRSVQLGQRVAPGAPLMAVIPTSQLWVDANFKESQLRDVRIGQPVKLVTDLYGSSIVYHGKVAGLAAAARYRAGRHRALRRALG